MTWPVPWLVLQGLYLGDALRCLEISTGVGLNSFCPWSFKLGRKTKTIAIHLQEVHYRMAIMCNICQAITSITTQGVLDQHSGCKAKCMTESMQSMKGMKRPKSSIRKRSPSHRGKKAASKSLRSDAAQKLCWAEFCSVPSLFPPSQSSEWPLILYSGSLLNSFLNEPLLNQMNCLILFVSHICCNVMVLSII